MITVTELRQFLKIQPTDWITAFKYNAGDYVIQSATLYECLITHTSGTFATDLTALKWAVNTFLGICITKAVGEANTHTNRELNSETDTIFLDGTATNIIQLNNQPIDTVTLIQQYDGDSWVDILDTGDTIANFTLTQGYTLRLLGAYIFPQGEMNIKITYSYSASQNEGLAKAILYNAAMIFYESPQGKNYFAKTSENLGGASSKGTGFDFDAIKKEYIDLYNQNRVVNI